MTSQDTNNTDFLSLKNQGIRLQGIVEGMKTINVLVVGDVMLDVYEHCSVERISPEAPVPVAVLTNESRFLGGACNVANNIAALGAQVSLIGVVGNDSDGLDVRELLASNGIKDCLVVDDERVTTVKRRTVSGTQQLLRVDREERKVVTGSVENELCKLVQQVIAAHDVVVVSDYQSGVLSKSVIACIKEKALKLGKKIFVDSKAPSFSAYEGVFLIKPNKREAEKLVGRQFTKGYENLQSIGEELAQTIHSNIIITLGGDGIALFTEHTFTHKTTRAQQVFDVSGAGDTVLAVVSTAIGAGATLEDAVELANRAAGHVVSRLGTATCTCDELKYLISDADTQ